MASFASQVYPNPFRDMTQFSMNEGAKKDSEVSWPDNLSSSQARNIINRFYALKGEGGGNSREHFRATNTDFGVNVECYLEKYQCNSPKKNGDRCTRSLAAGLPLCFQHCLSTFGVKLVRTSLQTSSGARIPMLGVFACRKNSVGFHENQVICPYIGEIRTRAQLEQLYPGDASASYTLVLGRPSRKNAQYIDSACVRGIGSYVNTATDSWPPTAEEQQLLDESGSSTMRAPVSGNGPSVRARANCMLVVLVSDITRRAGSRVGKNPQPWIVATRNILNGEELFASLVTYNRLGPNDLAETKKQNIKRSKCGL